MKKRAYLIYPGLRDESLDMYIGEIKNILATLDYTLLNHDLGGNLQTSVTFLYGKRKLSREERNQQRAWIEEFVKMADLVIEIVRGSDTYGLKLNSDEVNIGMEACRYYKKQSIILFPFYKFHPDEFERLSDTQKAPYLEGIPSENSLLIRSIKQLPESIYAMELEMSSI